jgi:hypothetical protein
MNCCFNTNIIRVCKTLNLSDQIVNFLAFKPPLISINIVTLETYRINLLSNDFRNSQFKHVKEVSFVHEIYPNNPFPWITVKCYELVKSISKKSLVILRIINKK